MVYALSKMTFIIASDAGKGGTWAGAIENLRANWVPSYVLASDSVKEGNAQLIQKGCKPFTEEMLTAALFEEQSTQNVIHAEQVQDHDKEKKYNTGEQMKMEF